MLVLFQKHYLLDLLGALCACDDVFLPSTQNSICDKWLGSDGSDSVRVVLFGC